MDNVPMSFDEMKKGNTHWKINASITHYEYSTAWNLFGSFTIESIGGSCEFEYYARRIHRSVDILIKKSSPMPGKAYINIISGGFMKQHLIENWTDQSHEFLHVNYSSDASEDEYDYYLDEYEREREVPVIVKCNTVWFGFHGESSLKLNDFNKNFTDYFSDSSLSDFTVITNKESIPVHKIILALQSPVFSRMFSTNMKENLINQVEIKDIDANIMKIVLKYLYTNDANDLDYDMEILSKILAAADKYEINTLKQNCQAKLAKHINLDTALDILLISGTHNGEDLLKTVTDFMVENKKTIVKSEKFKVMLLERPDMFVEFISKSTT